MSQTTFNKELWIAYIHALQDTICQALEQVDGKATFKEDIWEREDGGQGKTRVITNGGIFEKGGVNTSVVYGQVSDKMRTSLGINGHSWFACGLSLVLHPENPMLPTTHANWRYFELYDDAANIIDRWFGGGADLTPYYLFEEDVKHFHSTLKKVHDAFDINYYQKYKQQCDAYFANHHRGAEMRGVGGVFYDHLKPDDTHSLDALFQFQKSNGNCFLDSYLPIIAARKNLAYSNSQKYWQELRRGRYVEFNLLHDRGTIFGLKTNGRTESILMSLPPTVRFDYNYTPEPNSEEARLLDACIHPKDWV